MKIKTWRLVLLAGVVGLLGASPARAQSDDASEIVNRMFSLARANSEELVKAAVDVVAAGEEAGDLLVKNLVSRQPLEIVWALRCLKNMSYQGGLPDLNRILGHADSLVRTEGIVTSLQIDPAALKSRVFDLTADPELSVRRRAHDAAVTICSDDPRLLGLAISGLGDKDYWIFSRSLRAIAKFEIKTEAQSKALLEGVLSLTSGLDGPTAKMVFTALARKLKADLPKVLEKTLSQGQRDARIAALQSAANYKVQEILPVARIILRGDDAYLGAEAARYLSAVKDLKSAPELVELLATLPSGDFRTAVVVALRRLSGRSYGFEVAKWREWLSSRTTT